MRMFVLIFPLCIFALLTAHRAQAQTGFAQTVIACPASTNETAQPDFSSSECKVTPARWLDPQKRYLWVKTTIVVSDNLFSLDKPLGVFISAKASSEVYLNGQYLGNNGTPAGNKINEIPGRMDAVFFVPRELVHKGDNTITIRMSSHHGFLHFTNPVHLIYIGEYANPTAFILSAIWPSLIPFGALIAGALYFAAAAFSTRFQLDNILLALIAFFAAGQLFSEVYRGLFSYDYPVHEWRMILVLLFSLGFGLCLAAHIIEKFLSQQRLKILGAVALVTIASTIFPAGYDGKTAFAMLMPTISSVAILGFAVFKRKPLAMLYFLTLSLFLATIVFFPNRFLDTLFFYEAAALFLVLFVAQAFSFSKEREQHMDEQARSKQLALSLERAQQAEATSHLKISGAGKIDVVRTDEIAHCKGAGDYVEIYLKDGREILHNSSLTQLEENLPATFLRVHRSYLVNTNFIQSLTRENSGIGSLLLTTDKQIPVSRRIMPMVRSVLR